MPLVRPFLRRGVPPFFYRYDQGFLHWLYWNDKPVEFLSDTDVQALSGDDLAKAYDLIVYPGHSEYVTTGEYDAIERFRNLGGNLIFLSANNFFWKVTRAGDVLTRTAMWRDIGRPEAALIGVQYLANDRGERQGDFVLGNNGTDWLWAGTGLGPGSSVGDAVGGYGIEIDHVTSDSPIGTTVVAEIPDLFGPGLTAEMTYYETTNGAKVFAAGSLDFGGSASTWPVERDAREPLGARQRPLEIRFRQVFQGQDRRREQPDEAGQGADRRDPERLADADRAAEHAAEERADRADAVVDDVVGAADARAEAVRARARR